MDDTAFDRITRGQPMNAPDNLPPEDAQQLRTVPHSREAEQSVLGGLLLDPTAFPKISESLAPADFYLSAHRQIFEAISSLLADGKPIDPVTVFERLGDRADECGGIQYINALSTSVPSAAAIVRHAEIVTDRSTRRSIILAAEQAATAARGQQDAAEVLDTAKTAFSQLSQQRKLGSKQVPLLSLGELREQAQAVSWLIKHVIPADSLGVVFGASQTFKSFVALDASLHIARGLPWLGRRTHQGPVIYLAAEGGAGLWSRICAWHKARRLQWTETPMQVIPVALDLKQDAWRVVEQAQWKGVTPALVVVDTLSQTFAGEENSANEVAAYFRELGARFRALWHCAVMVIHHSGHNATERPRGSSAMLANVDWMFGVHRDEKEMLATLSCTKQKDGDRFNDAPFLLSSIDLGTDADGDVVRSLYARHLTSAEELQDAMQSEGKAGRGGGNQLILSLIQNGSAESDLRKKFYEKCGAETADARRQAYTRARRWAIESGFMEVREGYILTFEKEF